MPSGDGGPQPVFYYDLGDPESYLVAEQVMSVLPTAPEWEPVHGAALGVAPAAVDWEELAGRVAALGLQPLRVPPSWPPETETAMLAASYAKAVGRAVAFSLAAFRQVFAGGRDLGEEATVLIAAAACEMHPRALLKGLALRATRDGLARGVERAREAGVRELPAIGIAGALLHGRDALERAVAALDHGGARG